MIPLRPGAVDALGLSDHTMNLAIAEQGVGDEPDETQYSREPQGEAQFPIV